MNTPLEYYHGEDELLIYVAGEITHHRCEELSPAIDELINRFTPKRTTLDFSDVTFCDGSVITFILDRHKLATALGKSIEVIKIPPQPYKIFTLAEVKKTVPISPLKTRLKKQDEGKERQNEIKPIKKKTVKNQFDLKFPSHPVNEGFAGAAVEAFIAPYRLNPADEFMSELKTAVIEAVTNAVIHAYPDGTGLIHIKCRLYNDYSITVSVSDSGVGIEDIQKAREPLYTSGSEDRAGMGFTVMEALSDKITVRSRPGKGTTVTIFKQPKRSNEQNN